MTNWKTTLSGIGAACMSTLALLAALPYQLGDVATIIPPEWKAAIVKIAIAAAFILRVWHSFTSADASKVKALEQKIDAQPETTAPP